MCCVSLRLMSEYTAHCFSRLCYSLCAHCDWFLWGRFIWWDRQALYFMDEINNGGSLETFTNWLWNKVFFSIIMPISKIGIHESIHDCIYCKWKLIYSIYCISYDKNIYLICCANASISQSIILQLLVDADVADHSVAYCVFWGFSDIHSFTHRTV